MCVSKNIVKILSKETRYQCAFFFFFLPFYYFPGSCDVEKKRTRNVLQCISRWRLPLDCVKSCFCLLKPNLIEGKCSKFDRREVFTAKHNFLLIIPCFFQYLPSNGDPCL